MLHRIIGVRPEINNPYSIYEALVKPEWGFPGGRIQPHAGVRIGTFFEEISKELGEAAGIDIQFGTPSVPRALGVYEDFHYRPRIILSEKRFGHILGDLYNPKNIEHGPLFATLRHELYHHIYRHSKELEKTAKIVSEADPKSKIGKVRERVRNALMKRARKNMSYGLFPESEIDEMISKLAIEEITVESSARKAAGALGQPYPKALFGRYDINRVYGVTQSMAEEIGTILYIGSEKGKLGAFSMPHVEGTPPEGRVIWPGMKKKASAIDDKNIIQKFLSGMPHGDEFRKLGQQMFSEEQAKALRRGMSYMSSGWGRLVPIGAGIGAIYLGYLGISSLLGRDDRHFLSASALGRRGAGLERSLFQESEHLTNSLRATLRSGTYFHELVQEAFGISGGEAEVEVEDRRLGVKGYIDVLLPGNIPVEVKTISTTGFERLSKPLEPHTCLLPGELVQLYSGKIIPVEDLVVDDTILNRYGESEEVVATASMEIDKPIYSIRTYGTMKPLKLTHNHQILAIRTERCWGANSSHKSAPCFEGRGHCDECSRHHYRDYVPEWVDSQDLNLGDFILYPKIPLGDKIDFDASKYATKRCRNVPVIDKLDYAIGRLFGYYLAEGSLSKRQVIFSFHIDETEYTDEIQRTLKSIGLSSRISLHPDYNVRNVVCGSTALSSLLLDLCGKTKNKHVDKSLFDYNQDFLKGLLEGYINGDGHRRKEDPAKIVLGTASIRLAFDIFNLLIAFGELPSMSCKMQTRKEINGVKIKTLNPLYRIEYNEGPSARHVFIRDFGDYVGFRIRDIRTEKYTGPVYDIEVESTRSFTTHAGLVSNSQINFYMHAREAQYGYVMYLDGKDISRRKIFRVGYQPGRLMADVDAARSAMLEKPDKMNEDNVRWLTDTYQMSPAYLRGIRHSSGFASSYASIKPSPEFPGGRIASIVQASQYRKLGKCVELSPTMGLTIRNHETAIGHRSRGGPAKRIGTFHCNGSRTYRC